MKWPWNSNISLDEMETNGMMQLNSPFCKEKRKTKNKTGQHISFLPFYGQQTSRSDVFNSYIKNIPWFSEKKGYVHHAIIWDFFAIIFSARPGISSSCSHKPLLNHIVRTGTWTRLPQTQKLGLMLHSHQLNVFN